MPSVVEQLPAAWAGLEVKASSAPYSSSAAPRTVDTLSGRITISRVVISLALLSWPYTNIFARRATLPASAGSV